MVRPVSLKTTDTTGLDLNIISDISLSPTKQVTTGFSSTPSKASGIIKVSNMFYKILLTKKGTNPLDKNEGTDLIDLFEANINDAEVLFAFVSEQVDEAFLQLEAFQDIGSVSADERVTTVNITTFVPNAETNTLDFSVSIFVSSGESVVLQIPSIVVT